MKKIVLVLGLMVACVVSSQAINRVESGVISTINNENVFGHLSAYLNANEDQATDLKAVIEKTQIQLEQAQKAGDAKAYAAAMRYSFTGAANILTVPQYVKYCSLIRLTIKNIHLDRHVF